MRFLVDAQLPPALARWLAANGHETDHVGDIGMQAASDAAIAHALASSAAIITKDEDFARRKVLAQNGAVVVWIACRTREAAICSSGSRQYCRMSWRRWRGARPWSRSA